MNIFLAFFVFACFIIIGSRFFKKQSEKSATLAENLNALSCYEITKTQQPCVMTIDNISEKAIDDIVEFYNVNTEDGDDFGKHCSFERNGAQVTITFTNPSFHEVASFVNLFAWDNDGITDYHPQAQYHVEKMKLGDFLLEDSEITFYVDEGDTYECATHFRFADGRKYIYDLGSKCVKPL